MPTIAEQLTQLESDRQDLVDNLETKGITGLTGDETFTELVPEVLNIPSGGDVSDYFRETYVNNPNRNLTQLVLKLPDLTLTASALNSMFESCSQLTSIGNLTLPNTTNLNSAFRSCGLLTSLGEIDVQNEVSMSEAFYSCGRITSIKFKTTPDVSNVYQMFYGDYSLVEAPEMNTANATSMMRMFYNCRALTTLPLYDTSNVTSFQYMFDGCNNLTDESLNNILAMCINATSYTDTKRLSVMNLNGNTYRTRVPNLSNYQAFIDAGWTTGW